MLHRVASLPHIAYAVSELAAVTSLNGWRNTKSKVLGKISSYIKEGLMLIESVNEMDGPFFLKVSLDFFFFEVYKSFYVVF